MSGNSETENLLDAIDGATPLEIEELEQLKPSWITTREDLNEAEQRNIANARAWASRMRTRPLRRGILSERFIRELHRRMFGDVWKWAGKYRTTARNLGVEAYRIPHDVLAALDDCNFWVENEIYSPDEICIRLHHRIVAVHPFPNGKGRHARLLADLLARRLERPEFTWGGASLENAGDAREAYIAALREVDRHDVTSLIKFARS